MVLRAVILICTIAAASAISLHDVSRWLRPAVAAPTRSTEVTSLPGYRGPMPSKHFAGYITVDDSSSRKLYYHLVSAQQQQQQQQQVPGGLPFSASGNLLIWLTGGPGCSSMDAFTYEHGPLTFSFRPGADAAGRTPSLSDIQLSPNPFSWSKAANVLYIDSPAGTGFSYTPSSAAAAAAAAADVTGDVNDRNDDDDEKPYHSDDGKAIDDLEVFVSRFFEEYPELRQHRLFVAGESYAGVYVPLLTQRLLHHNQRIDSLAQQQQQQQQQQPPAEQQQRYNLAGYIVGNAVTDDVFDGNGQVEFAYGMGLVDPPTHHRVKKTCELNYWNASDSSPCSNALDSLERAMGDINIYDILNPCFSHTDNARRFLLQQQQQQTKQQQEQQTKQQQQQLTQQEDFASHPSSQNEQQQQQQQQQQPRRGRTWPLSATFPGPDTPILNMYSLQKSAAAAAAAAAALYGSSSSSSSGGGGSSGLSSGSSAQMLSHTIDCADRRHALLYYNNPEVRRAIHADSLEDAGRWEPCSDILSYKHTAGSIIPVHRELIEAGVPGLVLSGDHDYVVPFTGSRAWVYSLQLAERTPWHNWKIPGDQQVAGYAVEFEPGLTFATVKGAGHMVPQTQPQAALALLQLWLERRL